MANSKKKGDILEDLVALIYEEPSLTIEKRKKIKRLTGTKLSEIDVLITGKIADYSIQLAIECKNEKKKFNITDARNFKAKLQDIGIPPQNGIVVALMGFTKDAQEYLDDHKIRTYIFEGLTKDRLSKAVYECFESYVFYGAKWKNISHFPALPQKAFHNNLPTTIKLRDPESPSPQFLIDKFWEEWVNNKIPLELGEYTCFFNFGDQAGAMLTMEIFCLVGKLHGKYSKFSLKPTHINEKERDREKILSKFPDREILKNLELVVSQDELNLHDDIRGAFDVIKIIIPKLFMPGYFWPPSEKAAHKISVLMKQNETVTFEKVEGHDLGVAWESYSEDMRQFILKNL